MIQRIRALAKRTAPQMVALDINDVIREAILLVQREVLSHGVSLRTELGPHCPLFSEIGSNCSKWLSTF